MKFELDILLLWVDRYLLPIDDPGSRLFGINILSSAFAVFLYFFITCRQNVFQSVFNSIFNKRYWWNRSTKKDYALYLLNSIIKLLLLYPFVKISFFFSAFLLKVLINLFGLIVPFRSVQALVVFSVFSFIFDDFLRFTHHFLMHKIPILWKFHKTHHSARVLTPITLYRIHPMESIMATIRNAMSFGVILGFFLYFFEGDADLYTLFGINMFGMVFNFLASNLRHSHIPVSFGIFEYIFISPVLHQIHHASVQGHNMGVSLTLWDHIFGSFRRTPAGGKLRFGL